MWAATLTKGGLPVSTLIEGVGVGVGII